MIHLAVETSTEVVDMALFDEEKVLAQMAVFRPGGASELLVPGLETLLEVAGKKSGALELVSSSAGPGTYTSIRVGHLFCKGLAFSLGIPHLTISPFLALSDQDSSVGGSGHTFLAVLLDARRHEVNACLFDPAHPLVPLSLPGPSGDIFSGRAVSPEQVCSFLPEGKGRLVGPGVVHLPFARLEGRSDLDLVRSRPEAQAMGRLALRRWRTTPELSSSGEGLLYGRDSVIS